MARSASARRLIGHSGPVGRTLTERHRDLLDAAMRRYLEAKAANPASDAAVGTRHAVRAYANVVALNEGGYYPDVKTAVKRAESMSLSRLRGKIERHTCGNYILVNGMCFSGHDPLKPSRSS